MQIMQTLSRRLNIDLKMVEFAHRLPNFEMPHNDKPQPPLNLHA